MAKDIGGGLSGEGGRLDDAVDVAPSNPIANRQQFNFTALIAALPPAVLRAIIPTPVAPIPDPIILYIKSLRNVGDGQDSFTGWDDSINEGVTVAKPYIIQRSPFDTFNINGITYTWLTDTRRKLVADDGDVYFQNLEPPYVPDETRAYCAQIQNGSFPDPSTLWVDLNVDGRQWITEQTARFQITSVGDEDLTCEGVLPNDTLDGESYLIAKPYELRRSTYDGQTFNNTSYAYTDANNRTATNTVIGPETIIEEQIIVPPYRPGSERITAMRVVDSGVAGTKWLALDFGRQWQLKADF